MPTAKHNMDDSKKLYGVHDVDANIQYKHYFAAYAPYAIIKETTVNPMREIYKAFSTGMVTGRTVIDFCKGPTISHLLPMKDFVQEITVLDVNNAGVKEVEKWKNKDPTAFDFSHVVAIMKELKGNREELEDEEEGLRRKLKNILHVEHSKGLGSLDLPKADIATSIWFLDCISKDHDEYRGNISNVSKVMNLGGYLLLYACTDCSYFKVGEHMYHYLKCDESFCRRAITEGGFDIKHFQKFEKLMSCGSVDHTEMFFIIAKKVKEPQEAS